MTNPFSHKIESHPIAGIMKECVEEEFKAKVKRLIPYGNSAIKDGDDMFFLAVLDDYRLIKIFLEGKSLDEEYLAIATKEI